MISDKWKFDTTQNWEFLAKNFHQISNKLIAKEDLLRLDVYISAPGYIEKGRPYFTKVTKEYKEESNINDVKNEHMVFDSEEEAIKKRILRKEKMDAKTASLAVTCPSCRQPVPRLSTPPSPSSHMLGPSAFPSLSTSGMRMPGSSASSAFDIHILGSSIPSMSSVYVPGLTAPSVFSVPVLGFSALPSPFGCLLVPRLSALLSLSPSSICVSKLFTLSASGVHVPGLSALSASSVHMLELSAPFISGVLVSRLSSPGLSSFFLI